MPCTLMLLVVNKDFPLDSPDPLINAMRAHANKSKYKRGDVINVYPYGTSPGKKVEADERFKVVDCPDLTFAEGLSLCQGVDVDVEDPLWRRRAEHIDIDRLPPQKKNEMTTDMENRGTLLKSEIRAARSRRLVN